MRRCSGLGVIRKKPDIRYKPLDAIERLPDVQRAILEKPSARCDVKPGGALLYSTCTVPKRDTKPLSCRFCRRIRNFRWNRFRFRTDLTFPTRAMPRSCRTSTRRTAFSSVS